MSSRLLLRRALLALAGTAALAAAAPAVASADSLTLVPTSVPAASTSTSLELQYAFTSPTSSVTTELPPGLLANATIDGGACLATAASSTPPAACKVASGTVNGAVPVDLYLVQAPGAGDIAGLEVLVPPVTQLTVGAVTVRPASDPDGVGLNIAFTGLSAVTAMDLTFTDLRMPTSCPTIPATVKVTASGSSSAGLTVTGCSSLAYNPSLSAQVIKDSGDNGAEIISTISQPGAATESATKATILGFGSSLSPNALAVASCFVTACNVGTATATSPLLPAAAFSGGTVSLGGSLASPTLTISFPALNLSLVGAIDLTNNTVTFASQPDVPLSSLAVTVNGPAGVTSPDGGKAFITSCTAATLTGAFTPWDGNTAANVSAPISYTGCPSGGGGTPPGKPTVSGGSIGGLSTGHPKLHFTAKAGSGAPGITSVTVDPSGLTFKCVKQKSSCKGVSVSGGKIKSVKASGSKLVIKLKSASTKVSVTVSGPALVESKSLQSKVKSGKTKHITFSIKVTSSSGTTTVPLKLKA